MRDLFGEQTKRPNARSLLDVFDAAHRAKFEGLPAPIVGKKDGPLAARLMRIYSFEQLSACARLYFEIPDPFIQSGGYTFGVFSTCIGKVMQYERRAHARTVIQPRHEVTDATLRAAKQRDEANRLATQDVANDYYRRRPWLQK